MGVRTNTDWRRCTHGHCVCVGILRKCLRAWPINLAVTSEAHRQRPPHTLRSIPTPLLGFRIAGARLRLLNLVPGGIRIVSLHLFGQYAGLIPEILLVNDSIAAHDKGHYAGGAVLRRESHERKSVAHLAVYDVALRSARATLSLPRQDTEVITAVWG